MLTTVISETDRHRLVLTHYAPEEACRAHRHSTSQVSILLAGAYEETSAEGHRQVAGASLSCKPEGFEHENRFGEHGALMLSMHGKAAAEPTMAYLLTRLNDPRSGKALLDAAVGADSWAAGLEGGAKLCTPAHISPGLQKARGRLLADPDLSISRLARSMDRHPIHVARLFRSAFGQSPAQMRREARVARAIDRIVRSAAPLAEIAIAEGFSDQSHMTRSVGELTGWTPGALRRLLGR